MPGPVIFITKQLISFSIAFIRKVFPQPEGPYNKIPLGNVSPVNKKKIHILFTILLNIGSIFISKIFLLISKKI